MTEGGRKRRISLLRECDPDYPAKQRRVDIALVNGHEGRVQRVTRQLKDFFAWLTDLPSKNYFIESTMSAINLRGSSILKNKSDVDINSPSAERPVEESSIDFLQKPRYRNLKRPSVREFTKHSFRGQRSLQRDGHQSVRHSSKKGAGLKNGNGNCNFSSLSSDLCGMRKNQSLPHTKKDRSHLSHSVVQTMDLRTHREPAPKRSCSTTQEVLELQERDQYKVLLEHFTKSPRHSVFPSMKPTLVKDAEAQTNTRSAFAKGKVNSNELSLFLAKYVKGPKVKLSSQLPRDSTSASMNNKLAGSSSIQKKAATEDEVVITDVKLPSCRPVPSGMLTSNFFNSKWIDELRKSFDEETALRNEKIQQEVKKLVERQRQRAARLAEDQARNRNQYKLSGTVLPETVEAEVDISSEFPELTQEMEDKIDEALKPDPPEEVLSEGFNTQVTRKDIETLSRLNWLNDEIIYFYISLLMERSKEENYPSVYAFNTFFYPKLLNGGHGVLKRWTRKIDIFSYDLILVPVHMGMHWCLAVIDFRCKKIQYYDSMGGQNVECLHALRDYLKDEHLDKKKTEFDMNFWVYENVKNIPHQMNGSDCGMFALKYAEYITRDAKINFTQEHMRYFRRRMVYEILTRKLL